ncbi:hypothetical protein REPUB_Repub10bG0069500 [Reevesia pubescens]
MADKLNKVGPLRSILVKAWPVNGSLEIHDLAKKIFLFVFRNEMDKKKVSVQSPWPVMDHHLILKEWPAETSLEEIQM